MSYFMTTAGEKIDLSDLAPLEFVDASNTQPYMQNISNNIMEADGTPLYLIHDGETGTSDNFISEINEYFGINGTMEGSVFFNLLDKLSKTNNSIRVWWANNRDDAWKTVADIETKEELFNYVLERIKNNRSIVFAYRSKLHSGIKDPNVEI